MNCILWIAILCEDCINHRVFRVGTLFSKSELYYRLHLWEVYFLVLLRWREHCFAPLMIHCWSTSCAPWIERQIFVAFNTNFKRLFLVNKDSPKEWYFFTCWTSTLKISHFKKPVQYLQWKKTFFKEENFFIFWSNIDNNNKKKII